MAEKMTKFVKGGTYKLYRQNGDRAVRDLKVLARSVKGDALKVSYGNDSSTKVVHLITDSNGSELFNLPQYLGVIASEDYVSGGNPNEGFASISTTSSRGIGNTSDKPS